MKALLLTLIFASLAKAEDPNEMRLSDQEISRKLMSVARDIKNDEILKGATQLDECRTAFQSEYKPSSGTSSSNNAAITKLESCLQRKIGTGESAKRIAEGLSIDTYSVNSSKSVANVTDYLTKSLYRQLTGVNLDERDQATRIKSLSIKNKKQVDQKVFFELYKNQVAKNALFEISRFCFEDFRNSLKTSATSFLEHWDNLAPFQNGANYVPVTPGASVSFNDGGSTSVKFDNGNPNGTNTSSDAASAYGVMLTNISGNSAQLPSDPDLYNNFFQFCGRQINRLCEDFEKCKRPEASSASGAVPAGCPTTVGGKACIVKSRLTAYRNAMKASDKVVESFANDFAADPRAALNPNTIVKRFVQGQEGNKSINQLTNTASAEFYKETENDGRQEAENCLQNNGQGTECERFLVNDNSGERIEVNTELTYRAKREAELARVRVLVDQAGQDLETYLDENYPDLKDLRGQQLFDAISRRWDAKREGMIAEIKNKIKPRQAPADQLANPNGVSEDQLLADQAQKNAQDALGERTRLAQVVLFNNIVSGTLNLQKADGSPVGRNVQALNNELDRAEAENVQSNQSFENLRTIGRSGGGDLRGDETISDIGFLNKFIGVPDQQQGGSGN